MAGPWDPTFDDPAEKAVKNLMGELGQQDDSYATARGNAMIRSWANAPSLTSEDMDHIRLQDPGTFNRTSMAGAMKPAISLPTASMGAAPAPSAEDAAVNSLMGLMTRMKSALPTGVSPEEADLRRSQLETATRTDWKKPLIAGGALALLHLLGGKRGAAAAGRNMQLFTEGVMKGNEDRINKNIAGLKTGWDAKDAEGKLNADLLKSVVSGPGTELMKQRMTKDPKEYQLYELAQNNPDFAKWLASQDKDAAKALSSDQLLASYVQGAVARGVMTNEQAMEELGKLKSGYMPELLQASGVEGVKPAFSGVGRKKPLAPLTPP